MIPPTITTSACGRHFIVTFTGDATARTHQLRLPVSGLGAQVLAQILEERKAASAASKPDFIGTPHNPTQTVIDAWLKQNTPTTPDSKRQAEAQATLEKLGSINTTLDELGL